MVEVGCVYTVDKETLTNRYYSGILRLLCASHWVDTYTGEKVKIPQGLKTYYQYRHTMYNVFKSTGKNYIESHITVGGVLGVSPDTIKRVYNPLLKRMGLIETHGTFFENNITYVVNPVSRCNGPLINDKLRSRGKKDFNSKGKIDYDAIKRLVRHKKMGDRLQNDSGPDKLIIEKKEYAELRKIKKLYDEGK